MKITIEPTKNQSNEKPNMKHPVVTILVPDDDLTLPDVLEMLVEPALRAFGYGYASIEHVEKFDQ
jgi:hypothetical protein